MNLAVVRAPAHCTAMDGPPPFRPQGLGEIAIRCRDFNAMKRFYAEVIGLQPLEGNLSEEIAFFRIAKGIAGHTTVLALFASSDPKPLTGAGSSLHHVALSVPFNDLSLVQDWYDRIGLSYTLQDFRWIGWRGVFTRDPDGNTVELVAYDASLKD